MNPQGVTAIYIYEGRVLATASDFAGDRPGGFTRQEAQEYRARRQVCVEVVKALASSALYENLGMYDCEQIVNKMAGKVHVIPVGYETPPSGAEK